MELINEYIYLDFCSEIDIIETVCIAKKDKSNVYLTYNLIDNDCFFDFTNSINKIEIKISNSYFERYKDSFEIVSEKQQICCNTQSKLFELINCNLTGIARNLYIESLIVYLLYQIQKNNLIFQINCNTCSFLNKPIELDKIQKAKEYILNNLDQNLTIPIIAKFVGTNQCYLKKGFKEVYAQTIFDFIQNNRMEKAKHLLLYTNKTILEISDIVGYSSLSSFSQTYKNYFGISPSIEQNNYS